MSLGLYESDPLLHQYLVFHYARPGDQFPYAFGARDALDFPKRCAEQGFDRASLPESPRGLDLGCAVGRSTFELARFCREVVGIDSSHAFIDAAQRLRREGRHRVERVDEGAASTELEVTVDSSIDRFRATFEQGDAQRLRADIGQFDIVLAGNLICRMRDPMAFLGRLPDLVRPRGQVFITTPFSWLDSYTPRENWLGGEGGDSFAGLREALDPAFELTASFDMPFLIREHARKFQYSVAQASRWVRR